MQSCHADLSPLYIQDPAELWNNDYLQSKALLTSCLKDQKANALSDNRASAIACTEAEWKPKAHDQAVQKAPRPPPSQQAAALKTAVDKIVSGAPSSGNVYNEGFSASWSSELAVRFLQPGT